MLITSERVTELQFSKGVKTFFFISYFYPPQQNQVNAKLEFLLKGFSFKIMNSYKLMPYLEENVKKNNQKKIPHQSCDLTVCTYIYVQTS